MAIPQRPGIVEGDYPFPKAPIPDLPGAAPVAGAPAVGLGGQQQFMQWLQSLAGGGQWPINGPNGRHAYPWQRNAANLPPRPAQPAGTAQAPGFPLLQQLQSGGLGSLFGAFRGGLGGGAPGSSPVAPGVGQQPSFLSFLSSLRSQ